MTLGVITLFNTAKFRENEVMDFVRFVYFRFTIRRWLETITVS